MKTANYLEEYNSIKETEYIMKSPAMMDVIRQGEEDIKDGNCVSQQAGESVADFLSRASNPLLFPTQLSTD